jgi:hypothetical protein
VTLRRKRSEAVANAGGYAFVNKRVVRGVAPGPVTAGDFPRYVYWEEPDGPGDSGWRIFTGAETQADADDPSNFQVSAIATLLTVHPQLAQVISAGKRGAWEWQDGVSQYVPAG